MKRLLSVMILLAAPALVVGWYFSQPVEPDGAALLTDYSRENIVRHLESAGNPTTATTHLSPDVIRNVMGRKGDQYVTTAPTYAFFPDATTTPTLAR